jgi:hypothetical protein
MPKRKPPTRPLPNPQEPGRTAQQPRAQTAADLLRATMITGNPLLALAGIDRRSLQPRGKRGRR